MAATHLDDASFDAALASAELVIVDFFAGWCGHCVLLEPSFLRMADSFPGVRFAVLDMERAPRARRTIRIDNLPFFALYREGRLAAGLSTRSEHELFAWIQAHAGEPAVRPAG
ncbi:MAG: thioredoxin family protein [Sandaracinaceae bacterium]|nr:thioredoxin family protein [Sandaracinaceae bacterium]